MLQDIHSIFYSWIRGGILLLLLYHFIFYLKNREKIYLFYSIYLLGVFVFLMRDVFIDNLCVAKTYEYLFFPVQFIAFVFYIQFTRAVINTRKFFQLWDKAAGYSNIILIVLAIFLLGVQILYGFEYQLEIMSYIAPVFSVTMLLTLMFITIVETAEGIYLMIGSIIFLLLANVTVMKLARGTDYLFSFPVHSMFYYFIGILIQTIIYAMLLADTFKRIEEEKSKVELNLLKKSSQLYELKMTAFKNQMNPHFLFNSLNSINNFVIQNKKEVASDYITKFSRLIRKVLQTTEKVSIPLEEELRIAELYIKIEQVRLRNSFTYKIDVDESLRNSNLEVVPLYMQPFLENAIWHGLSLNEGKSILHVKIEDNGEFILTEIEDNGVGLSNSINKKDNLERKSYGIKTVKNRMELIYKKENVQIIIEDLTKIKKGKGTRVSVLFPKEFKV